MTSRKLLCDFTLRGEGWEGDRLKQLGTAALLSIVQSLSQLLNYCFSHFTTLRWFIALRYGRIERWTLDRGFALRGEDWEGDRLKQLGTAALLSIVQSLSQLLNYCFFLSTSLRWFVALRYGRIERWTLGSVGLRCEVKAGKAIGLSSWGQRLYYRSYGRCLSY